MNKEKWQKMRAKGLTRFILFDGVKLGIFAAVLALLSKYIFHWFTLNNIPPIRGFLMDNVSLFVSIILIAIPVAYWIWVDFDRKYNE